MAWLQFIVHETFQSYFWDLAFDDNVTGEMKGDCILNSNTDVLKAAMNHRMV